MRLIDVDALCERFEEECPGDCLSCDYCCATNGQLFCGLIASTPVVDAEPVRHGRWIGTGNFGEWYAEEHKCSICGDIALGNADNFCLNCGAKMDAEVGKRGSDD